MPLHRHNVRCTPFHKTNGLTAKPNFFTSQMWRACICLDVCACVCVGLKQEKSHFIGSCVRRPLTTHRPQSERSSTTACTVKQAMFEVTRHQEVTSTVANDIYGIRWIGWPMHIHTHTHPCMHAHIHRSHLHSCCSLHTIKHSSLCRYKLF